MPPDLLQLLREQHAANFRDVAGASVTLTLPVSDRLVTRLVAEQLTPSSRLRHLDVRAEASNRFKVAVQLARPAFLPSLTIPFDIERQPALPASPVLVLRVASSASVMSFAGAALRLLDSLPPGITLDGNLVSLDLRLLAARYGRADVFEYLDSLALTTEPGRIVLSVRAALPPRT
ncbi:MAG TPA: hypothetical protein VD833_22895 [Vicinamibacterales bacterium]|nr:hypothetical protein [Vicinamibacterales bacterium]